MAKKEMGLQAQIAILLGLKEMDTFENPETIGLCVGLPTSSNRFNTGQRLLYRCFLFLLEVSVFC